MRPHLLATTAVLLLTTAPAAARDQSWYVGVDLGAFIPHDPNGGVMIVDYTTTNNPSGIAGTPAGPADTTFSNPFNFNAKTGWDGDIVAGYDFGMFRVEGELGYKHTKVSSHVNTTDLAALNTAAEPAVRGA